MKPIGNRVAATEAVAGAHGGTDLVADVRKPWFIFTAESVMKCSASMQTELFGRKIISSFVEWCEEPRVATAGFATSDGCWHFDGEGGLLTAVSPHPDNNVYIAVPHSMKDRIYVNCDAHINSSPQRNEAPSIGFLLFSVLTEKRVLQISGRKM